MSRRTEPARVPTLTRVACPGDPLRESGLWLPLADMPRSPRQTADPDAWRQGMPLELYPRAQRMRELVRQRVTTALQGYFRDRYPGAT